MVRRFLNLKKKIVIKPKPKRSNLGKTWLNPNPKNRNINFLKRQNRTGGSLKKEEPHNTGHTTHNYSPIHTTHNSFFWGIFWGKEMLPNFLLHFFFWGPPNFLINFFTFLRLPNSLILFYFWLKIFPLFFSLLVLTSKFHYWFFFLFGFQISLFLFLASKFP